MTQSTLWQPSDIEAASDEGQGGGEAAKKRGRIPQSAWPDILERHRAGQTLTAIAREFDCTPSAISYIVRKAEAAGMAPAAAAPAPAAATPEKPTSEKPALEKLAPEKLAPQKLALEKPTPAKPAPTKPAPAKPAPEAAQATPAAPAQPAPEARPAAEPRQPVAPTAARPAAPPPAQAPRPAVATEPAPPPVAPTETKAPTAAEPAPTRPAGRVEPPPVDAVEGRLRDTARGCLSAYRAWRQSPGEASLQGLGDAVHELRKVLARLEIDMSASRRNEQGARPIPIPPHRAQRSQR